MPSIRHTTWERRPPAGSTATSDDVGTDRAEAPQARVGRWRVWDRSAAVRDHHFQRHVQRELGTLVLGALVRTEVGRRHGLLEFDFHALRNLDAIDGSDWTCAQNERPSRAWFKRAVVWVRLCVLGPAAILARSASEGSGYSRLRFGLVCRGCYPRLNQVPSRAPRRSCSGCSPGEWQRRWLRRQPGRESVRLLFGVAFPMPG